ncbi:MAG TPA: hypothetical protein VGF24_25640 [Vicinamibacterales bacterium]|jgi:hypothetical protein
MNDVRDRLKDADPVAMDAALCDDDVQRMRRVVMAAAARQPMSQAWARARWTAGVVVIVAIAISLNRWFEPRESPRTPPADHSISNDASESRRQMQFIAPGGTRVIWVFNDEFKP